MLNLMLRSLPHVDDNNLPAMPAHNLNDRILEVLVAHSIEMHLGGLVEIKEHLIAFAAVRLVIQAPFLYEILKQGTILHEHGTEHVHSLLAVTRVYLSRNNPIDYATPVKGYMEGERVNDITILSAVVESFKSGKMLDKILRLSFKNDAFTSIAPLTPVNKGQSENKREALVGAFNSAIEDVFRSSVRSWRAIVADYVIENTDFLGLQNHFNLQQHLVAGAFESHLQRRQ